MNSLTLKYYVKLILEGILNSFSQVYFSNSKLLAAILIAVSFFDFGAGIAAIVSIFICQLTALLFNFDHQNIRDGIYTYNSAMTGVAIGIFYQMNGSLLILLILTAILTFFLTVWFMNQLAVKGLPFLSIPFLIVTWLVILGGQNFSALELHEKTMLSLESYFPEIFTSVTDLISHLPFANLFYLYFRSLGAILFQYNDLAGLLVAIGILIHSRISFVLSIFGFVCGYLFYRIMEADFSQLIYSYIGFNFILTAIALGGFFIVASKRSFLLLCFVIPLIALIISGIHGIFQSLGLPLYSLPFNIMVILVLYALRQRSFTSKLYLVYLQHFSPEKNHYKHFNSLDRFSSQTYLNISLPTIGTWRVSQGNDGAITHKDDYRYALDFDVTDEKGKTYKDEGIELKDYYCYNLPVLAPASGFVSTLIDGIEDNAINEVDITNNWGNTIIIKHSEFLYSKLSHLKKESIAVKQGDYVYKGQVIASCGSSGRSPEPHLHFQLQATPYIGSKTLLHPIDYYLSTSNGKNQFHSFDVPKENMQISNVATTKILLDSFSFIPGQLLTWEVEYNSKKEIVTWEVIVNSSNQSYFYCHKTKSIAYFIQNGTLFYFTDFYGAKDTLLHHFYKGAHKVLLCYYADVQIKDQLIITDIFQKPLSFIHDFTAPFFHYLRVLYLFSFTSANNMHNPTEITFQSICEGKLINKKLISNRYHFVISENKQIAFELLNSKHSFKARLYLLGEIK